MNAFEAQALRGRAAAKTIERLRADAARASHRIRPLVELVEKKLFEPSFNYERIREALSIRDNNRTTLFRRELGLTPAAYVRDCRMEIACRLLRDTDLEVAWIAELVGYGGGAQVFTPAFKRYAGVTPSWFRRREREAAAVEALAAPRLPEINPSAWRRFVTGELPPEEAALLLRHLLDRYPETRRQLVSEVARRLRRGESLQAIEAEGEPAPPAEVDDLLPSLRKLLSREDVESLMAQVLWEAIEVLPPPEQRAFVRNPLRFTTPAFLRLLGEKCREDAASAGEASVRIARLALEYASAFAGSEADDGTSPWKALAWAWLGDAKRLALDLDGAEKAFGVAERLLPPRDDSAEVAMARCLIEAATDLRSPPSVW